MTRFPFDRAKVRANVQDFARWCGNPRERAAARGVRTMRQDAQTWRTLAHHPDRWPEGPEACMAWAILYRALYLGSERYWKGDV